MSIRLSKIIFSVKKTYNNFITGLLSRSNCKRFDCIFETIQAAKSTETCALDNELSGATWSRRLSTTIQSSFLQRDHPSVSLNLFIVYVSYKDLRSIHGSRTIFVHELKATNILCIYCNNRNFASKLI